MELITWRVQCHVTEISSHVIHSELSQPLPEDVWERFCWSLLVTRAWLEERIENSKFSQCIQLNAWFKFEHSTRAIGEISLNKNYRYLKAERSWKIYILCYNALYRKSGALIEGTISKTWPFLTLIKLKSLLSNSCMVPLKEKSSVLYSETLGRRPDERQVNGTQNIRFGITDSTRRSFIPDPFISYLKFAF